MARTAGDTRDLLIECVDTLLAVVEERNWSLRQHCERVANGVAHFCSRFHLVPAKEIDTVYFAALLHDFGLVFGPPELLEAAEEEADAAILRQHPLLAEKLLSGMSALSRALPFIRHHHEHWDGSGVPANLKGEDIPFGARLIALFDCFDGLTSPPFPRQGIEPQAALEQIIELSGRRFDGSLVDSFAQYIESAPGKPEEYIRGRKTESVNVKEVFSRILQKFAAGRIALPVMPRIVQELQQIIDRPNPTADDLAAAVEKEPVIALRLVSIANSPAYRGMKDIRSVRQAIPRLGLKETMNLVVAIANKSLYETPSPHYRALMEKLWAHALAAAYGAKKIALHLGLAEPDVLFLLGLTHDIGKTFLLRAFSEEEAVKTVDVKLVLTAVQEAHLGIGQLLLKRWGFDEAFLRAAAFHEKNDFDPAVSREALVVNLANFLTRAIGYSLLEGEALPPEEIRSARLLGIDPEECRRLSEETAALMKDLAPLL